MIDDSSAHNVPAPVLEAILRRNLKTFVEKVFITLLPPGTFVPNWHIAAVCYQLERVLRGEINRLIINLPPRSGKSIMASVAFPAYVLGHHPEWDVVCVSYNEELATKLARDQLRVMDQPWYQSTFPETRIDANRRAEHDFRTTRGGGRLSTSIGGTLTGRGGHIIIGDDLQKAEVALSAVQRAGTAERYANTIATRLNDKLTGAIILIQHRLHVDDLTGQLVEKGGWTVCNLPAIAPADTVVALGERRMHRWRAGDLLQPVREPISVLDRMRAEMGSFDFEAQYNQNPLPPAGNLIKLIWLLPFDAVPEGRGRIVQSWDLAVRDGDDNDFSVCVTAKVIGNTLYVVDVFRDKLTYPAQRRALIAQAKRHKAQVILVEAAGTGGPLVDDLRSMDRTGIPTPIAIHPRGSKLERARVQSHRIEAGDVRVPTRAPWLDSFTSELAAFPNGRHDDQVDALVQMLQWHGSRHNEDSGGYFPGMGGKLIVG